MNLYNESNSIEFYDNRYKEGYMEDWPYKKKQRIKEIIRLMNLPEKGLALDYGCGNGVFTEVIKDALPGWEVYGSDISAVAVENAGRRFLNCTFFTPDDALFKNKTFDLIFSHHVLEHVYDIDKSVKETAFLCNKKANILHVLPCGNEGSLEHDICENRTNGINGDIQNRFFYEDPGHIRRLKSRELAAKYKPYNFYLADAWFSNQYYGALDWISNCDAKFIYDLTATDKKATIFHQLKMFVLKYKLLLLFRAKSIERYFAKNPSSNIMARFKLFIAKSVTSYYLKQTDKEWALHSKDENGSEMYLYFKRE